MVSYEESSVYWYYFPVKPYIDPITTHALQVGDDATLICVAQGQPRPKLTWTFNNKSIGNDPRVHC